MILSFIIQLIYVFTSVCIIMTIWHYFDLYIICWFRKQQSKINSKSRILITGGCMGIGRQTALQFATKQKSTIIILDIRQDLSDKIIEEINQAGGKGYFYKCDISNPDSVVEVIKQVYLEHESVEILINNAGIVSTKFFQDTSLNDFQRVTKVNYLGPVQIIQLMLPKMIERQTGHIVNIASVASISPAIKTSEYVASKHALWGFHHCLRQELKYFRQNVDTTIICPWGINTGMFKGFKTIADRIFPILDEKYVGLVIYESILAKRKIVFIDNKYDFITHFLRLIPCALNDWFSLFLISDNIKDLVGRNKKNE